MSGRLVICNKDVQRILGRQRSTAHKVLSEIRKFLNKPKSKPITIDDFCAYMGLDPGQVRDALL